MEHPRDLVDLIEQGRGDALGQIAEVTRKHQQILRLAERALGDVQKPGIVAPALALGALGDVARVTRRTPGTFRTRVLTEGVVPSLHVNYKRSRIKQYHKEGRALRTETTINNTYDFGINRGLHNLAELRKVGFQANRRLLDVQRISQDCSIGEDVFHHIQQPVVVDQQRAASLRFSDPRVRAALSALVIFRLLPRGFSNRDLREHVASLLGLDPSTMTQGKMTYDLRRLRLHGLVERIPKSHRYGVTDLGLRAALFFSRAYARIFRPGLAIVTPHEAHDDCHLRRAFDHVQRAMDAWCDKATLTCGVTSTA